jgi:alcohol dehydrogenase class IV
MKAPTITYLSNIYFEAGALSLLPELLQELKINNPLLVTDPGLVALGIIPKLGLVRLTVFKDVETNPSEVSVLAGLDLYREKRCDGIVAVGGGSPMDCAKGIALLVYHPQPLEQYAFLNGGLPRINQEMPPLIAVPTTAGTGSEVGRAALISMNNGLKMAFLSAKFIPKAVLCDPTLTLDAPPKLTAGSGLDAISHCVETFCSPRFNPVTDAIALDGLKRACDHIRNAVHHGKDITSRSEMMMAALQGGLSFQKGLGFIHSLSHPLGGLKEKRLHHGTLNGIFLPHVLRYNMEACPQKMDAMAVLLGLSHAEDLPRYFQTLSNEIGSPSTLSELGVSAKDLEPLAEIAHRDHCSATNPRPVTLESCRQLYNASL